MTNATTTLLRALRARRPLPVPAIGLGALLAAAAGFWAAPDTIGALSAGETTHWGGWPLESAFTGCVLVACIVTFRIHESFYRSHDAGALRMLPLDGGAVARDRFLVALRESALACAGVAVFLAPAYAREGGALTAVALAYCAAAALIVALVSFAAVASAGPAAAEVGAAPGAPVASRAAAFNTAPGLAFAAAAGALLVTKLGFEEPIRLATSAGVPRSAWLAGAGPLAVSLVAALWAWRRYGAMHDEVQALYIDADSHRSDVGHAPLEGRSLRGGRAVAVLGPAVGAFYRKDRAQLTRSAPFLRAGSAGVAALLAFAAWATGGELSAALVGGVAAAWLVAVVAPQRRAGALPGESEFGLAAALASPDIRDAARAAAVCVEVATLAVVLALPGLALGMGAAAHVAAIVLASAAGLAAATALRASPSAATAVAAIAAAAAASAPSAGALTLAIAATALAAAASRIVLHARAQSVSA